MSELRTPRTELHRERHKGRYDRETVYAILDAGFLCHIAFVEEGQPFAVPTAYARDGDDLLIHGSAASRMLKVLRSRAQICITVTLADGIVLARSAFDSSFNYRSVMILGVAEEVTEPAA
ncbi:MAG: pyridoxamine 5'-phosphate oxidase family protein, partial [Actinomycetota bacterium]